MIDKNPTRVKVTSMTREVFAKKLTGKDVKIHDFVMDPITCDDWLFLVEGPEKHFFLRPRF